MIRHSCKPLEAEGWLRLILMHVAGGLSLKQTAVRAKELGWAELTDVALLKRLAQAYAWLADLTAYLLSEQRRQLDPRDWSCAHRLRVLDATDINEPGSIVTDWRLHYSIRLPELVCDHYELTDCHGGEKLGRFAFEPGELVLVDAGYSHRRGVAHLLDAGAQVLGRWNALGFPLEHPSGRAFAPLRQLRSLAVGQVAEWPVQFRHGQQVYRLRLCALRKSPQDTEQSRRKLLYNATRKGTFGLEALRLRAAADLGQGRGAFDPSGAGFIPREVADRDVPDATHKNRLVSPQTLFHPYDAMSEGERQKGVHRKYRPGHR